jgi:hypothetical protein
MGTEDFKDAIRSFINAWEDGKLSWQEVNTAVRLCKKAELGVGSQSRYDLPKWGKPVPANRKRSGAAGAAGSDQARCSQSLIYGAAGSQV